MKRAVLAITAALSFALVTTDASFAQGRRGKAVDPAVAKAAAMAKAPGLVTKAGVTCTVTDARDIGAFSRPEGKKKVNFDAVEVACSEGMGFVLLADEKDGPVKSEDCITQKTAAAGAENLLVCNLPGNANPSIGLQPFLTKAGSACKPTDAIILGRSATARIYEVACAESLGQMLVVPDKAEDKPSTFNCLASASQGRPCKLTSEEANMSVVKALGAKAEKPCTITGQRFVLTSTNGDYFEYACSDGTGYMVVANLAGQYQRQIPCTNAMNIGGGCTLTDVKSAMTAEAGLYTKLSRTAGFDCDVEKYGLFPPVPGGKEIVELACKNRKDGAIAVFTGDGKDQIMSCARGSAEGYKCSYTPVELSYPALTDQLKARGRGTCEVNGVRPLGVNATNAFLEVSCSDGAPGWVLSYPKGVNTPDDLLSCGQARGIGGGCKMPTNQRQG